MNWEEERAYTRRMVEYLQEDPVKYNAQFALEIARDWEAVLLNPEPNYAKLRAVVEKARTQPNACGQVPGYSLLLHPHGIHIAAPRSRVL